MKFTITNRLRATIIVLGGLAIGNLALMDTGIQGMSDDAALINHGGRLRSLVNVIAKFHLAERPNKEAEKIQTLQEKLNGLRNGDAKLGLDKATEPEMIKQLDALDAAFKKYIQILEAAERNPKLNPQVVDFSEEYWELCNKFTEYLEKQSEAHVASLRINELIILALNLAGLAGLFVIVQQVVKTLNSSTTSVASASTQIASTIEQQERSLAEQAASVNETTTTIEELGASSRQAAEQADASAAGAQQAIAISGDGSRIVSRTMVGIGELREKVEAIADKIMQLSEQTAQISSISDMVSDIASQTNMLSLNAAVEAARAGEQGKGFAVVAGEVRKLAEQSKKSADKIKVLVSEVQASINSTVMVTDEGTKTAQESIRLAEDTATAFNGIASSINDVFLNSQQIALSAKQQAVAVQQAVSAMNAINLGARETSAGVSQVKAATKDLAGTAKELQAIV